MSDKDIDAILAYVKSVPEPGAGTPGTQGAAATAPEETDNTLLFGILTLVLAIVAFVLLQVNANLKNWLMTNKVYLPWNQCQSGEIRYTLCSAR